MDRFIVITDVADDESVLLLKSNMDRFIERTDDISAQVYHLLKSNMDRLIVNDKSRFRYYVSF